MESLSGIESYWIWFALAGLLAIGEIAVAPGIFLIFIAAAALGVGIITSVVELSMPTQLLLFGLLSIASVYFGKSWYKRSNVRNDDPMLNDRSARLIGQTVTVTQTATSNEGRVKLGDSEWPARGPGLEPGTKARVRFVEAGILQLEEIEGS